MITNREEVIDKAFKVFLRMNYEKASISTLAKACGVVKTGVVYYFPHKLDLFMAVADKYVIQMQTPANKFAGPTETLAEFIEQYVAGVSAVMNHIIKQVQCCVDDNECCPNFYYFHFLSQVRMYYPGAREKMEEIFRKEHELWKAVIQKAKESGEIKQDTDVQKSASLFRQVFLGLKKPNHTHGKFPSNIPGHVLRAIVPEWSGCRRIEGEIRLSILAPESLTSFSNI